MRLFLRYLISAVISESRRQIYFITNGYSFRPSPPSLEGGKSWTIVGVIPTIDFTLIHNKSRTPNNRILKTVIRRNVEKRRLKCAKVRNCSSSVYKYS